MHDLWRPRDRAPERDHLPSLLKRFLFSSIVLCAGTWLLAPEQFFRLPVEEPLAWVGVILLYPILAVYPQELTYRAFFLPRYTPLFSNPTALLFVNALAFGWAHVAYGHVLSIILSAIGGAFFFQTYRSTGSLRLACLEHALYGDLIFTVGLGGYFYSDWANS
jgi:membrane protease YdiL (CAAX protease family)